MPLVALALVEAIAFLCGVTPRATEPGFADRRSIAAADVLVIYTGHNEFGGYHVRHPRTALLVREHPWLLDLRDALAQTRFYSLVSPPLQSDALPAIETPDPDWDFEGRRQIALEACLRDLTATLDIARAEGVPVLLVTVVSNLSECPFPRSQWDQVLERVRSSPSPPRWLAEYARGIELERAGDRAGSLEAFRRSRDGVAPALRAPTALNDALRELARGRPEVHLVDFERELDALGPEEGIGCNCFGTEEYCDGVHQNPRTSQLIARSVGRTLLAMQFRPTGRGSRRPGQRG